jgi:hypothetical protein
MADFWKSETIAMKIRDEEKVQLVQAKAYRRYDDLQVIEMARAYLKNRLPVPDRATAIAILSHRDSLFEGLGEQKEVGE